MSNQEYLATQNQLIQAGHMLAALDINSFKDRIRTADSLGAILDPTLYRAAQSNLQTVSELATAGIRYQAAFRSLRNQIAAEGEFVNREVEP